MAQVAQSLRSLAGTMGRRGGISGALLRGADAELDMKRIALAEGRSERSLGMREEKHEAEMAVLGPQVEEAKRLGEMFNPNVRQLVPPNKSGAAHILTPSKDGKSIMDSMLASLGNVTVNEKGGQLLKPDGSPYMVSRGKWEKRIKPGLMYISLSGLDPVKKAMDLRDESEKGSPEYNEVAAFLKDPVKIAHAYSQKINALSKQIAQTIMSGGNPEYINLMKAGIVSAGKKITALAGAEKANADLQNIKLRNDKLIKEIENIGKGDPITPYQKSQLNARIEEIIVKEMDVLGSSQDPEYWNTRRKELKKTILPQAAAAEVKEPAAGAGTPEDFIKQALGGVSASTPAKVEAAALPEPEAPAAPTPEPKSLDVTFAPTPEQEGKVIDVDKAVKDVIYPKGKGTKELAQTVDDVYEKLKADAIKTNNRPMTKRELFDAVTQYGEQILEGVETIEDLLNNIKKAENK